MSKETYYRLIEFVLDSIDIKWVREFRFHPTRRWRFDYAIPKHKIAIEFEGGIWIKGRHNRGKGFCDDCIKYNEAVKLGWRVLRYTTESINFETIKLDIEALKICIGERSVS